MNNLLESQKEDFKECEDWGKETKKSFFKKFLIWKNGLCERCKLEPKSIYSSSYCEGCINEVMKEVIRKELKNDK